MADTAAKVENGWLAGARRAPSPHADARPPQSEIELVLIHGASLPCGEFGGPWLEALFAGRLDHSAHPSFAALKGLRVAPHLLIRRDGEIVQFVPFGRRAWHAGRSSWRGRIECNDFSIGIELEGSDEIPYTDAQYAALVRVIPALAAAYPGIGGESLAGHGDVAPERKTDPGAAFDWERLSGDLERAGYNFRRSRAPREGCGA